MKHRKLMAMLLSLVIALTFMPAVAFADEEAAEGTEPAATELQGETAEQPETPVGTEPAKEEADAKEIHAQENEYLVVGGVPVKLNQETDSGTGWTYISDGSKLQLTGVGAEPGSEPGIEFGGFNLTIEVVGNNNSIKYISNNDSKLEITGEGTLKVVEHSIRAENVKISGSNIDINSSGEGIQADEEDGIIEISGGSVTVTSKRGIVANKIIISGNKTRVESSTTDSGWAIQAFAGIEIRDPLRITLPDNGEVVHLFDEVYTIIKHGEEKVATHVVIEPKPETYDILIATAKANGKESIDLSWNKLDGVDGYDVFFSRCNTKKQKYTCEYAGSTDGSATAWSKADLKRRTPYKMYVMAYVMSGSSKIYVAKSPTVHAYTGGGSGRYTNPKSVKVKKSKVTVKKNKTYKIKASVRKLRKGKRLINGRHARKLRYLSSNTSVAKVTRYGTIKGVAPGTCDVYVLAVNGSYRKVAVTVK